MSDENEKIIRVTLDVATLKRLLEHLKNIKKLNLPGVDICETVEELVALYIKQMFRIDTMILESMVTAMKKCVMGARMNRVIKEMVEGTKKEDDMAADSNNGLGTLYDDEDDEDMDDEFFYYDDDEEWEIDWSDCLQRVDIRSEEYKAQMRKEKKEEEELKKKKGDGN